MIHWLALAITVQQSFSKSGYTYTRPTMDNRLSTGGFEPGEGTSSESVKWHPSSLSQALAPEALSPIIARERPCFRSRRKARHMSTVASLVMQRLATLP